MEDFSRQIIEELEKIVLGRSFFVLCSHSQADILRILAFKSYTERNSIASSTMLKSKPESLGKLISKSQDDSMV